MDICFGSGLVYSPLGGYVVNSTVLFLSNDLIWSIHYWNLSPISLPCQSNLFSIFYPILWPLNVLQIMAVGLLDYFLDFYIAFIIYLIEWPSITSDDQPKLLNCFKNKSVLC